MDIRRVMKKALIHRRERKYQAQLLTRVRDYREWLSPGERKDFDAEVPSESDSLSFLLIQIGEGSFSSISVSVLKEFFMQNKEVNIVYADEDVRDGLTEKLTHPWFKPDWSPDTFLQSFYWGSFVAVRRSWIETGCSKEAALKLKTALQKDCRNHDEKDSKTALMQALLLLAKEAGGFQKGCKSIGHIPKILFHGQSVKQQEELVQYAVGASTERISPSFLSIIIPSKDHPDLLGQCIKAVMKTAKNSDYEIVVIDNGSSKENREKITSFIDSLPISVTYWYQPMEFNFSAMCNLGVEHSRGDLLLFLNDDVEVTCDGWLKKMADKALQPYVGAVGMKLYYPGGTRIQHAGITNLPMGPVHKLQFCEDQQDYYYGWNRIDRNMLAVTAACLMVERKKYHQAGGMKEVLQVAFNDVDLCFCLWEQGYHNVVLNHVYAYHHESFSRGADETPLKLSRLVKERDKLYQLHPGLKGHDPYYPAGLNREGLDTGIRPAYLTAGNRIQEVLTVKKTLDMKRYRRDDCLLFRIEQCDDDCIQGYGVVLGDHNACYKRYLVLWKMQEEQDMGEYEDGDQLPVYSIALEGQYRPDLDENMPDQKYVGLCGFQVHLDTADLEPGSYRVGMAADSTINRTRLINWSNRWVQAGRLKKSQ